MHAPALSFVSSGYAFGGRSFSQMVGVHPELTAVAFLALQMCPIDFGFYDGLRTIRQQEAYLKAGTSWSADSWHLTGDAMDLVPWVDGEYSWSWHQVVKVADAVRRAATTLGVPLTWGGAWDRTLNRLGVDLITERDLYIARRRALGKPARPDGVHFQRLHRSAPLPAGWRMASAA